MTFIQEGRSDGLDVRIDGPVAILAIDNLAQQNMLTTDALGRLERICAALRTSRDIHVTVVRGIGAEFFCTGLLNPDLRGSMSKDEVLALVFQANAVFDALETLPQVVIAGLNGLVRAGGAELALACDIRVAAAHAGLSMPEAKWGGFPGAGGPVRLPALVGYSRAMELVCSAREIDADDMLRIGFVERLAAPDAFERILAELSTTIAGNGPLATRGAKRIMQARKEPGFRAARELSDALRRSLEFSADVDEAIAAHRQRRPAKFTGR
jgi:enoyl-CoA hydratase/carnithine racemase